MVDSNSTLTTKLSPLIEGQVPDFIQADYPVYVQFLKSYYKFLESGELKITVNIDSLLTEHNSPTNIVDETKGEKIILESGSGSTGKFDNNEIITGSTSKATATVYVEDTSNNRLFISAQQRFITGETITGATSGAQGVITSYRGNPVQNIQQLVEYANPDNTIDDMLENFRRMFMKVIPASLASGVSKRNLIKSIRELYTAKGTSEGHKFFLRLLLDDNATILYPEKFMMRASGGVWSTPKIIRATIPPNVDPASFVGQQINANSGAKAIIVDAAIIVEAGVSFAEYEIDPNSVVGIFVIDEQAQVVSKTNDFLYKFNIKGVVGNSSISSGGILHTASETLTTDSSIGNGLVSLEIDTVNVGDVNEVIIDEAGTNYRIKDSLTFTASGQSNTANAAGFVSAVGGIVLSEDGITNILLEDSTTSSIVDIGFLLEDGTGALILDRHEVSGGVYDSIGFKLFHERYHSQFSLDTFGSVTDGFMLEEDTFRDLSVTSESGSIRKIFLSNQGGGYSALPTIDITTDTGSSGELYSSTDTIGSVEDIKITNAGYNYTSAPSPIFKVHLLVKNITGTFSAGSSVVFNSYDVGSATIGTVDTFSTSTNILSITPTIAAASSLLLNGTDASSTNANENILYEDGGLIINSESFHSTDKDSVISTSAANATIVKANVAKGSLTNSVITTKAGSYPLDNYSTLGEATVRIQDSYFYQQFSYEINVGGALADYIDELRTAVHPAGFNVFGKVTIATQIAAGISILTGKDVPEYTGDTDTFTPELASTFKVVYDNYLVSRRLGTTDDGSSLYSTPMDVKELDADDLFTDTDIGFTSTKRDLTLNKVLEIETSTQPLNRSNPNALKLLNRHPFMPGFGGIILESTTEESLSSAITWDHGEITGTVNGSTSSSNTVVLDNVTSISGTDPLIYHKIRNDMFAYDNAGISSVVKITDITGVSPNYTITLDASLSFTDDSTIKFQYDFSDNATPPTFDQGVQEPGGQLILDGVYSTHTTTIQPNNITIPATLQSVGDYIILDDGADTSSLANVPISEIGSLTFTEIIQYHIIKLEGPEGTYDANFDNEDYADNIILDGNWNGSSVDSQGDDLILEDGEQLTERLPWPETIWSHTKEKQFTFPSAIHIS